MDKKDFDKQFDVDYPAGRFDLSLDLIVKCYNKVVTEVANKIY